MAEQSVSGPNQVEDHPRSQSSLKCTYATVSISCSSFLTPGSPPGPPATESSASTGTTFVCLTVSSGSAALSSERRARGVSIFGSSGDGISLSLSHFFRFALHGSSNTCTLPDQSKHLQRLGWSHKLTPGSRGGPVRPPWLAGCDRMWVKCSGRTFGGRLDSRRARWKGECFERMDGGEVSSIGCEMIIRLE